MTVLFKEVEQYTFQSAKALKFHDELTFCGFRQITAQDKKVYIHSMQAIVSIHAGPWETRNTGCTYLAQINCLEHNTGGLERYVVLYVDY